MSPLENIHRLCSSPDIIGVYILFQKWLHDQNFLNIPRQSEVRVHVKGNLLESKTRGIISVAF